MFYDASSSNRDVDYYVIVIKFVFFNLFNGVRVSPLGTSATNWRIVPAPDDR
jgi:hypothetical protein